MCRLQEQKHTEQGEWLVATLVSALLFASIGAIGFVIEPASAHSEQSRKSIQSAHLRRPMSTKARKSSTRRRISQTPTAAEAQASMSNHVEPELKALTPHSDLTAGQKADAEVITVLKYGARKHAEGNYEEAEAAFRHVLSRDPSNVDAFYDLGALAERRGDLIAALSNYRAALALKPHDKEIAEAVTSIERALRNRPAFSFRENQRQAVRGPSSPVSQLPSLVGDTSAGYDGAPVLSSPVFSTPVLNTPVFSSTVSDLPPLVSPQLGAAPDSRSRHRCPWNISAKFGQEWLIGADSRGNPSGGASGSSSAGRGRSPQSPSGTYVSQYSSQSGCIYWPAGRWAALSSLPLPAFSLLMAISSRLLSGLVSLSIFCVSACLPGSASDVRISRPAVVDLQDSCCQGEADATGQARAIVLPGSALADFNHWRKRFINPVFCPVLLCHGSCGNFDDACTIEPEGVLNRVSGCAGSCK